MTKRFTIIILIWLLIDAYFFTAVLRLTHNPFIITLYWLVDIIVATILLYGLKKSKTTIIALMIAPMTLLFVPKLIGSGVLLLEDFTRLFRGFPPRSYAISELVLLIAALLLLV